MHTSCLPGARGTRKYAYILPARSRGTRKYAYILPTRSRGTRKSAAPRLEVTEACKTVLTRFPASSEAKPPPPSAGSARSAGQPPLTTLYRHFSFFLASQNRLGIRPSKKCSKGATLRHTWLPGAPEGDPLAHPGRPKPSKYGVLPRENTHFQKVDKSQLWVTLVTILGQGAPEWSPRVSKATKRDPKRAPILEPFFA